MRADCIPTIVVWILAIAGSAVLLTLPESSGSGSGQMVSTTRLLLNADEIPIEQVDRISLTRGEDVELVFEREGQAWTQTRPFAYPMDPYSIRQLVSGASSIESFGEIESEGSAAALGLDPPRAILTFEWKGGSKTLKFGRRGIAGRAYLQIGDEAGVHLVSQTLHERAVSDDPREWRDRTIFAGVDVEADRFERHVGNDRMVLVNMKRQWSMTEPVATRVDGAALNEFIGDAAGAKMGGFVLDQPEDLGQFGLTSPAARLSVTTSTSVVDQQGDVVRPETTQTLLVGNRMGATTQDRFAMIQGRSVVFRLPSAVLASLFRQPTALIDPTGSGAKPADVKGIIINGPDGSFVIERDLDTWQAPDHGGAAVAKAPVERMLALLTGLRAVEVWIGPYPHELEVATITLMGFNGRPLDTVRIVREAADEGGGERRWGMENGDGVLRIVPASTSFGLRPADYGLADVLESTE